MIGSRLIEISFPDKHAFNAVTIDRFKKFFNGSPEEIQNEIIINGIFNLLLENFSDNQKMLNFMMNFLLEKEKKYIRKRMFVRYE